jgi:lipopolysaccharide transport system ATP-binding protein
MNEVSKNEGRTVLFVSHNMGTMKSLCNSGLLLKSGEVSFTSDNISDVITKYYETTSLNTSSTDVNSRVDRGGDGRVRIELLEIMGSIDNSQIQLGQEIAFRIRYSAEMNSFNGKILLSINSFDGNCILFLDSSVMKDFPAFIDGAGEIEIQLSNDFALPQGKYYVNVAIMANNALSDHIQSALILNVVDGLFFSTGKVPFVKSLVYVQHQWSYKRL